MRKLIFTLIIMAGALHADGEKAGKFDYYVLALSWTPTWCALEGDARGSEQCDASKDFGWTLHGLWPQFHQGWPSYCNTIERQPSRSMTNGMSDIMGTSGLAWHQWKKHGTCSGLSARGYYALSREAYGKINRPALFRKLKEPVKVPAKVIEEAFLKENPSLKANTLTITCKQGRIQEARVCFSKALDPVPCGRDTIKDCSMTNALFDPAR